MAKESPKQIDELERRQQVHKMLLEAARPLQDSPAVESWKKWQNFIASGGESLLGQEAHRKLWLAIENHPDVQLWKTLGEAESEFFKRNLKG